MPFRNCFGRFVNRPNESDHLLVFLLALSWSSLLRLNCGRLGRFRIGAAAESQPEPVRFRACPAAHKFRIAEWARQAVKRIFWIIPFVREVPRVQKSLVDRVPQLAGSKFMKFTDYPALKPVSGPIRQASCDNGLNDLRPCPDCLDKFPVHSRIQMSRICWASSGGPSRFDQMRPSAVDYRRRLRHPHASTAPAGRR
jgi:hypothetical protein